MGYFPSWQSIVSKMGSIPIRPPSGRSSSLDGPGVTPSKQEQDWLIMTDSIDYLQCLCFVSPACASIRQLYSTCMFESQKRAHHRATVSAWRLFSNVSITRNDCLITPHGADTWNCSVPRGKVYLIAKPGHVLVLLHILDPELQEELAKFLGLMRSSTISFSFFWPSLLNCSIRSPITSSNASAKWCCVKWDKASTWYGVMSSPSTRTTRQLWTDNCHSYGA